MVKVPKKFRRFNLRDPVFGLKNEHQTYVFESFDIVLYHIVAIIILDVISAGM